MSMGDLSTFSSLPQSLSSEFYSFSLLSLHLGIWFFEAIVNGIVFIYSFSVWQNSFLILIFTTCMTSVAFYNS
jgi:hypothetical protein